MISCQNCNKELSEETTVCDSCGTPMSEPEIQEPVLALAKKKKPG